MSGATGDSVFARRSASYTFISRRTYDSRRGREGGDRQICLPQIRNDQTRGGEKTASRTGAAIEFQMLRKRVRERALAEDDIRSPLYAIRYVMHRACAQDISGLSAVVRILRLLFATVDARSPESSSTPFSLVCVCVREREKERETEKKERKEARL